MQILRVDYLPQHLVPIENFQPPTADVINLSFGPFNGSEQESLEDSRCQNFPLVYFSKVSL
jgi:hypothetical protein